MKKVYVITEGQFSNYNIVKCCATKERAFQFLEDSIKEEWTSYDKYWNKERGYGLKFEGFHLDSMTQYDIEEYELLE